MKGLFDIFQIIFLLRLDARLDKSLCSGCCLVGRNFLLAMRVGKGSGGWVGRGLVGLGARPGGGISREPFCVCSVSFVLKTNIYYFAYFA